MHKSQLSFWYIRVTPRILFFILFLFFLILFIYLFIYLFILQFNFKFECLLFQFLVKKYELVESRKSWKQP